MAEEAGAVEVVAKEAIQAEEVVAVVEVVVAAKAPQVLKRPLE